MTLWAQASKDKQELINLSIKQGEKQAVILDKVRNHQGVTATEANRDLTDEIIFYLGPEKWKFGVKRLFKDIGIAKRETGFHFTRRIIAIGFFFGVILLPKILVLCVDDLTLSIGYFDIVGGLLALVSRQGGCQVASNGQWCKKYYHPPYRIFNALQHSGSIFW